PLGLSALYSDQRAHGPGDAGAGGGNAEALSRDREDAVRGPPAAAFRYRSGGRRGPPALAAATAAGRERDQICRYAAGTRRGYRGYCSIDRGSRADRRDRYRAGLERGAAE